MAMRPAERQGETPMASHFVLAHRMLTDKGFQTVGQIVAEMQAEGTAQVLIDRWLQGLERGLRRSALNVAA